MAVPAAGNLLYQVFATLYLRGFVLLSGGAWRRGDYSNHDCDEYGSERSKFHWQCPSVYRVAQHDTAVPHNYPATPLLRFFFSSRRRHTRFDCDWSSDVCSSDLANSRGSICMARSASWLVVRCSMTRSEERRVGKGVEFGGRLKNKKKKRRL